MIISSFVDIIFKKLRSENSDARLGCLFITNYFFQRSHQFRLEIVNFLQVNLIIHFLALNFIIKFRIFYY